MSIGSEILRQEAYERAMANYRAKQAVRQPRKPAVRQPRKTCLGRGARRISREEAVALIAKKSPRGAWRLLAGYLNGTPTRRDK